MPSCGRSFSATASRALKIRDRTVPIGQLMICAISSYESPSSSPIQPVANKSLVREAVLDPKDYLAAHRQLPSPELYRPVNNRAPAAAR